MLQHFYCKIHAIYTADGQVIMAGVSPFVLREVIVEGCTLLILFADELFHIVGLLLIDPLGPLGAERQRSMNEDIQQVFAFPHLHWLLGE